MMVLQYFRYKVEMNFTKCIFKIKQGDDKRSLFQSCFINGMGHFRSMLKFAGKFWEKTFLDSVFYKIVRAHEGKYGVTNTRSKYWNTFECYWPKVEWI